MVYKAYITGQFYKNSNPLGQSLNVTNATDETMTGVDMEKDLPQRERQHTTISMEDRDIAGLARDMSRLGFQAGQLGRSVDVWQNMLDDEEVTIFLGLAGAMVPAGLKEVVAYLIRERMVDCVVSTGANLFHDLCEGLGVIHYRGDPGADDAHLKDCGIDRIFDVYISEEDVQKGDRYIVNLVRKMSQDRSYSSRELMELMGSDMPKTTILGSAQRAGVPIFVPALCDSSIGIGMVMAWRDGHKVMIDQIRDVHEITQITEQSTRTGVVFVGGGVPKNFIQQTKVVAALHGNDKGGHNYAIQYTIDPPYFGGLSGCTFSEAVSWGKVDSKARMAQAFVDATIALPFVAHALKGSGTKRRIAPRFDWQGSDLALRYEARSK